MGRGVFSLRETIESHIKRANELYSELENEVNADISNSRVSARTSELTEEIMVKLRVCLDKGINQYRQQKNYPINKKLYFPISNDEDNFKKRLNLSGLIDLDETDPKLYDLLYNVQPFVSNEYEILSEIDEQGSKKKHRELSFQEKEIGRERITFSSNSGVSVNWDPSCVKFGPGVSIIGVPINPDTQLPQYKPNTHTLKKEHFISVKFHDKNVDVLQFCKQSIDAVQKIANQIVLLSEER